MNKKADSYAEYVVQDLLGGVRGVRAQRMFGGHGVYLDGVICGLIANEVLYLKVGDSNRADYEAADCQAFTYRTAKGAKAVMSYRELPADVLEDREKLEEWVRKSAFVSTAALAAKRSAGKKAKHR